MKTMIIYSTKYGSTEKYAYELQKLIPDTPIKAAPEVKKEDLEGVDQFIFFSNIYMGSIKLLDFINSNKGIIEGKKHYLVTVGLLDKEDEMKKLPGWLRENMAGHKKVRGVVDPSKLTLIDKIIYKFVKAKGGTELDLNAIKEVLTELIKLEMA